VIYAALIFDVELGVLPIEVGIATSRDGAACPDFMVEMWLGKPITTKGYG
jgi:hypothetical protein